MDKILTLKTVDLDQYSLEHYLLSRLFSFFNIFQITLPLFDLVRWNSFVCFNIHSFFFISSCSCSFFQWFIFPEEGCPHLLNFAVLRKFTHNTCKVVCENCRDFFDRFQSNKLDVKKIYVIRLDF